MIDEALYKGLTVPDAYEPNYNQVLGRTVFHKIVAHKTKMGDQSKVIKVDSQGVGSYNPDEAFSKT